MREKKVKPKAEIITFKADTGLLEAMKGITNRSEFIRSAILSALGSICPLCKGSGILSPRQKEHWLELGADHLMVECSRCHEFKLVCSHRRDENDDECSLLDDESKETLP